MIVMTIDVLQNTLLYLLVNITNDKQWYLDFEI